MASNKEILEAQRFNRRRLVTAFSSGLPGGKEIPPSSPVKPLIFGLVISVLILVGGAIASRFTPVLPDGWENSTLVVVKGTGARYFTVDGTLRPVTNVTSARLLSEPGKFKIATVSADTIVGIPRGSAVGLSGVPDDTPEGKALRSNVWLSCPFESHTVSWVAGLPEGPTPARTVMVKHADDLYLLAGSLRHKIAAEDNTAVLLALELDAAVPANVNAQWLNLFEQGSDLAPLEIPGAGKPAAGMPQRLASAVVGSLIEVTEGENRRAYVVTGDRTIARLFPVAERLYRSSRSFEQGGTPLTATVSELNDLTVASPEFVPEDWPEEVVSQQSEEAIPCASLISDDAGVRTQLMTWKAQAAEQAAGLGGDAPTSEITTSRVIVPGGTGALVRATSGGTLGTVVFVADDGHAHGLGATYADNVQRLGWDEADIVDVPAPWLVLIPEGAALIPEKAWETVAVL